MGAASNVKPSWYKELKDPSEHKWGRCTWCQLHWGHAGPCLIDFTSNKKTSRRVAVAAATSLKIIRPSFKNGTQVRHQFSDGIYYHGKITKFNRNNATYTVHFYDGEVLDDMKAQELDALQQLAQPGAEAEVEVEVEVEVEIEDDDVEYEEEQEEVPQVIEASAVFPNIEEFMTKARLGTYTDDMMEHGWDDVQYLYSTIKELADFSKLMGFPIRKSGHKMKMLSALRDLV